MSSGDVCVLCVGPTGRGFIGFLSSRSFENPRIYGYVIRTRKKKKRDDDLKKKKNKRKRKKLCCFGFHNYLL